MEYFPRLLLLSSLPDNHQSFRTDRKHREIRRRVALARFGAAFTIHTVSGVRVEELGVLLRRFRPTHLHITCHGVAEALLFENRRQVRADLPFAELCRLVGAAASRGLRFVGLEVCHSAMMASRLTEVVPSALGMSRRFDPERGDTFFPAFYQSLAAGRPLQGAFADARLDLEVLAASAARTPLLFAGREALKASIFAAEDAPAMLGIPEHEVTSVVVAEPLVFEEDGVTLVGHDEVVEQLDAMWELGGLAQLRGPAGAGKTRLLARWLARLGRDGWAGATRVFAWSFSRYGERVGGNVGEFLCAFRRFLGAPLRETDGLSDWELGRYLGRALRRERSLLVLDGVVPLPGRARGDLEARLHPGLSALLRAWQDHSAGLCVLTASGPLELDGCRCVRLPELSDDDARAWLWGHGVIRPEAILDGLCEQLRPTPRPLALSWLAKAVLLGTDVGPAKSRDPLVRAFRSLELRLDARVVLAAVALRGGLLTAVELRDLWEAWSGRCEYPYAALEVLAGVGLLDVSAARDVFLRDVCVRDVLIDAGVVAEVAKSCAARGVPFDGLLGADPGPLEAVSDLPRLGNRLRALVELGAGERALNLYIDRIARCNGGDEWSYIGRRLGRYAEDLELLGFFFASPWTELHPCVADATLAARAYIFHRVGLALRNVGQVGAAEEPLRRACELYDAGGVFERVATTANDLAELLACCRRLDDADGWVTTAVEAAETNAAADPRAGRQADVTLALVYATRGWVRHRLGEVTAAAADFERAEQRTAAIAVLDAAAGAAVSCGDRYVFSRPGLYYWLHLLDRLEAGPLPGEWASIEAKLVERLKAAVAWHGRRGIAGVSPSFHEFAYARLCSARLTRAEPSLDREALIDEGEMRFAATLALLYRHHHIWMVPEVLIARARFRRRAGDQLNAALDESEAQSLAVRLGIG